MPDGLTLVSASADRTVRRWDQRSGEPKGGPLEHTSAVVGLAISRDGRLLAARQREGPVVLWDAATGEPRGALGSARGSGRSVSFSADGLSLIDIEESNQGIVRFWDLATRHCRHRLMAHADAIYGATFSPKGHLLVTTARMVDRTVKLWETGSGAGQGSQHQTGAAPARPLPAGIRVLAGRRLLIGSGGRPDHLRSYPFAGSTDNHLKLVSGSLDDAITVWDVASGAPLFNIPGQRSLEIHCLVASPDGRTVVAGGSGGSGMDRQDLGAEAEPNRFFHQRPRARTYYAENGRAFANSLVSRIPVFPIYTENDPGNLFGIRWCNTLAFRPPPRESSSFGTCRNGRLAATLSKRVHPNRLLAFSPDFATLLAAGFGTQVRVWETASRRQRTGFEAGEHTNAIRCLVFTPDSKTLITGASDRAIKIWNLGETSRPRDLIGHGDGIESLSISPDGTTLASGGLDGGVRLWDLSTNQELAVLGAHSGKVRCVAFSPDGTLLASGGESSDRQGEVYLWHAGTNPPKVSQPRTDIGR